MALLIEFFLVNIREKEYEREEADRLIVITPYDAADHKFRAC